MADELTTDLLGEDLTLVVIHPLQVDTATGAISDLGSSIDVTARILEVDPTLQIISEDIRPVNEPGINMVPHSHGTFLRLVIIQDKDVTALNVAVRNTPSRRFRVDWVEGGEEPVGYFTLRSWNGGIKNRGMNPAVLDLDPMKPTNAEQMQVA